MNLDNIIKHLRSKPSVGRAGVGDEVPGILDDIITAANAIGIAMPPVKEFYQTIVDLSVPINQLQNGLESLTTIQNSYNATIKASIKSSTFLIERERDLAKALGISGQASAVLSKKYYGLNEALGISSKLMNKYRTQLDTIAPGMSANIELSGNYGKRLIETNDVLQQHIGLTGEQANAMQLAAAASGTNLEESLKNASNLATAYGKLTNETGVFAKMMEGVADTSLDLRIEYSKFPNSLEIASLKARKLGLSMEDINSSAVSMMDIETSVGKELEYQLLSGKRLVDQSGRSLTNRMRQAKLEGNAVEQANVMTEILTTQSATLEGNNYFAKQALASATGLTVAQLQAANAQRKLQENIYANMDEAKKKQFKSAMEIPMAELEAEVQKLSGNEKITALQTLKDSKSIQQPVDRIANQLDKLVDDGIYLRTKGLDLEKVLAESVTSAEKSVGTFKNSMSKFFDNVDMEKFGARQLTSQMLTGYITATKVYLQTQPLSGGTGTGADLLNSTVTNKLGNKATPSETSTGEPPTVNDGIIKFHPADKFMRVNDSTMIAGTNVDGNRKLASALTGGGGMDMNKMISAIQSALAGITINLDPMAVDKAIKFKNGYLNA